MQQLVEAGLQENGVNDETVQYRGRGTEDDANGKQRQ